MKVGVILNESHNLLPQQKELLLRYFGEWEIISVPANGWTLNEIRSQVGKITRKYKTVVFASPIPVLLKELSYEEGLGSPCEVYVFHNDRREKKELPNGKIIQVVAKEEWVLV